MCHTQIDTDRTGNKVGVGISPAPAIHRTSIHTSTASDAIQSLDMIGMGKQSASSVIYNDNMIFASFTGIAILRGIGSDRLPCCRTRQQTGKHSQSLHIRHDLLHTESSNIQCRARCPHISISFVRANHYISSGCYGKVGSRHSSFRIQKDVPQAFSGGMGQISRIKITFLRSHFLFKQLSHLFTLDVNSRKHNMTWRQIHQLKNTLSEIGLHNVYSFLYQERV